MHQKETMKGIGREKPSWNNEFIQPVRNCVPFIYWKWEGSWICLSAVSSLQFPFYLPFPHYVCHWTADIQAERVTRVYVLVSLFGIIWPVSLLLLYSRHHRDFFFMSAFSISGPWIFAEFFFSCPTFLFRSTPNLSSIFRKLSLIEDHRRLISLLVSWRISPDFHCRDPNRSWVVRNKPLLLLGVTVSLCVGGVHLIGKGVGSISHSQITSSKLCVKAIGDLWYVNLTNFI